jgi:hypothetical protein
MSAFREIRLGETGTEHPEQVSTGFASANLFPMLGAHARIGRLFTPAQECKDNNHVALLTDSDFERRFHRKPGAIGGTIRLGGAAYTVIGVLPPKFHFPAISEGTDQTRPDVWVPLSLLWNTAGDETVQLLYVMAWLAPGATPTTARGKSRSVWPWARHAAASFANCWRRR